MATAGIYVALLLVSGCGDDGAPADAARPRDARPPREDGAPPDDAALDDAGFDAAPEDAAADGGRDGGGPPPGTLDRRFGVDGIVRDLGLTFTCLCGAAVQEDGKILFVGGATVSGRKVLALVRLNEDGTLDMPFGDLPGIATRDAHAEPDEEEARDVAIAPDGRILVAGQAGTDLVVVRFLDDGRPDFFGSTTGYVLPAAGANVVRVNDAGTVTVAGHRDGVTPTAPDTGVVVRLTDTGFPDESFFMGFPLVDAVGVDIPAMRLQTGGQVLVAASDPLDQLRMTRYLNDGTRDMTFGMGGAPVVDPSLTRVGSIVLQGGPFVVVGRSPAPDNLISFARYSVSGELDSTFGMSGRRTIPMTTAPRAPHAVAQSDGSIVAAGPPNFTLVRITEDGAVDRSFGTDGRTMTPTMAAAQSVALMPDGRIVVGGTTTAGEAVIAMYVP